MSYALRNTLFLAGFVLLIAGPGIWFTYMSYPKQIKVIDARIKQLNDSLQAMPQLADSFNRVTDRLTEIRQRWEKRDKEIPAKDTTGQTYGYLNQLITSIGSFNMNFNYASIHDFKAKGYGYNEYNVNGRAYFDKICKFLWYIENGRRLFKVPNISMVATPEVDSNGIKVMMSYNMSFYAFYSPQESLHTSKTDTTFTAPTIKFNPFYPLVTPSDRPIRAGEIEIRTALLKMVINGQAYIIDQYGKPRTIEEGDRVYLGHITKVYEDGRLDAFLSEAADPVVVLLSIGGVATITK